MTDNGVDFDGVRFDPATARAVAGRLDGLAARLEGALRTEGPSLRIIRPSGADEVSVRAAATFRSVAASYSRNGFGGVLELRQLAATLRSHADRFDRSESESAAEFGAAVSP